MTIYYEISASESNRANRRWEPTSEWFSGQTSKSVLAKHLNAAQSRDGWKADLTKWDVKALRNKSLFLEHDDMLYVGTTKKRVDVFEGERNGWCSMNVVK